MTVILKPGVSQPSSPWQATRSNSSLSPTATWGITNKAEGFLRHAGARKRWKLDAGLGLNTKFWITMMGSWSLAWRCDGRSFKEFESGKPTWFLRHDRTIITPIIGTLAFWCRMQPLW